MNAGKRDFEGYPPFLSFTGCKKIFLRIPAVFAEMFPCEGADSVVFACHEGGPDREIREIVLLQNPADPDIDRKCLVLLECKEEDTVSSFGSDTGEFHKFPAGLIAGKSADSFHPGFFIGNDAGGSKDIGLAVSEAAHRQTVMAPARDR